MSRKDWQGGTVPSAKKSERQIPKVISPRSFRRKHYVMKTMQESKMAPPIFIGRWTPKVFFSLKERPYPHGQFRPYLGSVSPRMLKKNLPKLQHHGLNPLPTPRANYLSTTSSLT